MPRVLHNGSIQGFNGKKGLDFYDSQPPPSCGRLSRSGLRSTNPPDVNRQTMVVDYCGRMNVMIRGAVSKNRGKQHRLELDVHINCRPSMY
jgi:hypothetical protein